MERTTLSPSMVSRVWLAGVLAPLVEVPLLMVWMFAVQASDGPTTVSPAAPIVVRAVFGGAFLGLFGYPPACIATLLVGVPVVLTWLRVFDRIGLPTIVSLGAVLSVGPAVLLGILFARGNYHMIGVSWLALSAVSGVLIAATGWWIAFGALWDRALGPRA